jgi:RNA polymerase sigma-70 factor, ECF subfamily
MTHQPFHEKAHIERAKRDPEAFRALYQHYFPRVFGYVAYRVGRAQDAEDITAEIFMRVVEHIDQFIYRGEGSFAAWLFRIAYSQVADFYRRTPGQEVSLDELPDIRGDHPSPDSIMMQKEKFAQLRTFIQGLSPRRQEIVTLRFYGGLRNQEIAEVLGLDERTVASHLSRALEDLQRQYAPESEKQR